MVLLYAANETTQCTSTVLDVLRSYLV